MMLFEDRKRLEIIKLLVTDADIECVKFSIYFPTIHVQVTHSNNVQLPWYFTNVPGLVKYSYNWDLTLVGPDRHNTFIAYMRTVSDGLYQNITDLACAELAMRRQ